MSTVAQPPALEKRSPLQLAIEKRGIDEAQWNTLSNSLFPGAKPDSVLLVIDYCKARRLDPMKKPCHIVPMRVKQGEQWGWRDVVMPGIYEYRTTAMRTGLYLGHSTPEYGPDKEQFGVVAPEWCAMTMFRGASNGERIEFPVRVYFREAVALKDGKANDRWAKAPFQMLTKCTEAAGLREAFPDEFGGEPTAEEMTGRGDDEAIDVTPIKPAARVSQQPPNQPPVTAVAAASEPEPEKPAAKASIGVIVDVQDKGHGIALVVLETGYGAATKDAAVIQAAASLRDKKQRVELIATPSTRGAGFASRLTEIVVVESGEATS